MELFSLVITRSDVRAYTFIPFAHGLHYLSTPCFCYSVVYKPLHPRPFSLSFLAIFTYSKGRADGKQLQQWCCVVLMVYRRGTVASLTGYETGSLVFTTLVDATRGFKRHTELEQHKEEVCVVRRSVEIMCFLVDVIRGSLLTLRCFRPFCRLSFTREAMALRV